MKLVEKRVLNKEVETTTTKRTCTNRTVTETYKYRIEYRILVDEETGRYKREVVAVDDNNTDLVKLTWYNDNKENAWVDGEIEEIEKEIEKYI